VGQLLKLPADFQSAVRRLQTAAQDEILPHRALLWQF
jgi:hypothetical protein